MEEQKEVRGRQGKKRAGRKQGHGKQGVGTMQGPGKPGARMEAQEGRTTHQRRDHIHRREGVDRQSISLMGFYNQHLRQRALGPEKEQEVVEGLRKGRPRPQGHWKGF